MRRRFTDDQVVEIQTRLANGDTTSALAQEFEVSTTTIKNVRRGLYKKHPQKTGPKAQTIHDRLWAKIEQKDADDCWPWTGASRNGSGTPTLGVEKNATATAYRVLYEDVHQIKLESSINVLHTCRNPRCMNPKHLYLGDKDAWAKQLQKAEINADEIEQRRLASAKRARDYYRDHTEQRKSYVTEYQLERKLAAVIYKGGSCQECGEDHPAALNFHHRDPSTKSFDVNSKTLSMPNKIPWSTMRDEIEKCDLLCGNCHNKHHSAWTDQLIKRKRKTLDAYGLANIYEKKY
jgi:5-methylcytosine-specific restriction endonuclease McrA